MLKQNKLQIWQSLTLAFIAAMALYATVPSAYAADSAPVEAKSFSALDTNQDGFVDQKEASASPAVSRTFSTADANKDGRLSPEEYAKAFSMKP